MADFRKLGKGVAGALKQASAEASKASAPKAPTIIVPSKISAVKEAIRQSKGEYGAKRVERAADEIKNLERLYKEQALREAFGGDNAKALMSMNPKDFEKYSAPLDPRFMDESSTRYTTSGERLSYPEYMEEYLPNIGAFNDVPFLQINKQEQGLPLTPFITGHEGRHRNRVMAGKGEKAGLVQLLPRAELREPFPRRSQEEYIEALKEELALTDNMVMPEKIYVPDPDSLYDKAVKRPAIKLPDVYARGGLTRMARGGTVQDNLKNIQNYSVLDSGTSSQPLGLKGVILSGASWLAGDEKTKLAREAFGQDVTNTAIGGQKTSDVLKQLNDFESQGGTFAPGSTVVLDIGANDIAQGVDKNIIRDNLNEIVSRLGDSGVNVILSGQPEANSYDEAIASTNLQMDDLYNEIAQNHSNVVLVDAMSGFLNQKDLMDDSGFHLNSDDSKLSYLNKFADAYKASNFDDQGVVEAPAVTEQVAYTPVDVSKEIEQITQVDKPQERYTTEVQADIPTVVAEPPAERQQSDGYRWAVQGDGLDTYYQNINNYLAEPRTQDEIVAAMEQYGVSQDDIDAARSFAAGHRRGGAINKARGGVIHMQKGGKSGKAGALGKIAQAIQSADKEAEAIIQAGKLEEALRAKQAPMTTPQGTGLPLMPRSAGMYTPGVEQKDLPRMPTVDKARAAGKQPKYNERMQDLLDSPTARKKIDKLISQGEGLGVREWYGTEPIRQVAMDIGMTQKQFEEFMAQMASASQRNPVDQQNKMGSYLYYLSQTGRLPEDAFLMTNKIRRGEAPRPEGTAIELPEGYGSLAQGDIFSRGKQIASGDIEGALPPDKKLGTFYRNYLGNLKPVTVDVNAVRGPIIERGDPRWLASKLVEKDEKGKVIATHFPRKDVESGKMSLKEAKARPGFWEAAPSGSEYAGFEELWQRGAKRHSMAPAEAQALGWYGSADVTALKTKPELYVENLERMIRRTAEQTGQNPRQVMEDVLRGKQYLKAKGGSVNKQPMMKIKAYGEDIEDKIHDEFAAHINAARGGEIKKISFRDTPPLKKAQGGMVPNPNIDNTTPDSSDSGMVNYAPKFADGGMADQIPGQSVSAPPADQKSYSRLMAEILGRMAKDQAKEEATSLRKPRAATDLLNRGMVAPAIGAPVDIMNMGLEGIDAVRDLASGKRVENRLASERPFLGSEHLKDVMSQYGMTTDQERPMMETGLSLFSPAGAVKGASKAAQMATQAKRPANPFMRRPSNLIKQPG